MIPCIPCFTPLDDIPGHGELVELVGGIYSGEVVLLVHEPPVPPLDLAPGESLEGRMAARKLLESLLDGGQLAQWRRSGIFWVPTPFGRIRLGRVFDIRLRRSGRDPIRICVVPERFEELPQEDIWVNLLLVLRSDPKHFFEVANWQDPGTGTWYSGPVPVAGQTDSPARSGLVSLLAWLGIIDDI
jgi:hypothetical protein